MMPKRGMPKHGPSCQTQFLGWDRPLLTSVVDYLWETAAGDAEAAGCWQLGSFLAVLPTQRASRQLAHLLEHWAEQRGLSVQLPRIITVGELAEFLYQPPTAAAAQPADELERTLAWTGVLERTDPAVLQPLFPTLPPRDSLAPWMELATTVRRLHEDLAAAELSFADVAAELASTEATAAEQQRWDLLQSLHGQYLHSLADSQRYDPLEARREAIAQGRCHSEYHLLLIGTSDLSDSLRAMLRCACEPPRSADADVKPATRLTALVAAEAAQRDHFDPFGSIIASRWCQWKLPLRDDQLLSAGDATEQATVAAQWASAIAPAQQPGELTLGVTDESFVPPVEFELRQAGHTTYRELGWSFSQTPVGRLLELLPAHLGQQSWQSLAALVRHADVYQFIDAALAGQADAANTDDGRYAGGNWLVSLDSLLAEHYPTQLAVPLPDQVRQQHGGALAAQRLVAESLAVFTSGQRLPLVRWAAELDRWLAAIYPASSTPAADAVADDPAAAEPAAALPAARRAAAAVTAGRKLLQRLQRLHGGLDVNTHAASAVELLAGQLMQQRISDTPAADAISIVGWLDLALEDAPAMAIVGVNQPYVPEAITADPFLPGGLRTRLRMSDNERRLGRDVYALQLMLASRRELRLIVGRSGVDGSPTPPSRLLAAAEPGDVARRLVQLLDHETTAGADTPPTSPPPALPRPRRWSEQRQRTQLPIPVLDTSYRVRAMSVTAFTAYLACPYRFYLRQVLGLKPIDDAARELAANQFGDLVHNSLEEFGKSSAKDAADPRLIEEALLDSLATTAAEQLGSAPAPAVRLQIEQARRRLQQVAQVQARWRRAGWQIDRVEASVGEAQGAGIDVDGQRMIIRGRFDRIDRHADGRWAILDYKTHGHPPRKKHLKKVGGVDRWVDLQLPIYRLMIPYLVGDQVDPQSVTLGYFNVSEKATETRINEADFTAAEFAAADEVIQDCIRAIWAGRFDPTTDPVLYDDYAMILQAGNADAIFDSLAAGEPPDPDNLEAVVIDWREQ